MLETHVEELVATLGRPDGIFQPLRELRPFGAQARHPATGRLLPGHADWERVLVAIEDVTERETARRRLAESEDYARGLFDAFPGFALGRGFQQRQASARRRPGDEASRLPRLHRRAPRIRRALHERDPGHRRQPAYARPLRRARQGHLARSPRRHVQGRHAATVPRTAHRSVGRQAVPAARGRELHAGRRRSSTCICNSRSCRATRPTGPWCRSP